jgi:hypothetical protein
MGKNRFFFLLLKGLYSLDNLLFIIILSPKEPKAPPLRGKRSLYSYEMLPKECCRRYEGVTLAVLRYLSSKSKGYWSRLPGSVTGLGEPELCLFRHMLQRK